MGLIGKISGAIHHAIDKGKDAVNNAVDKTKKGTEEAVDKTKNVVKQGVNKLRSKKTYEDGLKKLANSPATISEKIDYMTRKLDDSTYGYGSTALAIAVPEIYIAKATADAIVQIQQGKPPMDAIKTVAIYGAMQVILGREISLLQIPPKAFAAKAVRERLMSTPAGKEVMKRIAKALPSDYKKLVKNVFDFEVEKKYKKVNFFGHEIAVPENPITTLPVREPWKSDIRDVIHPLQEARVNPRFPIKS